MRIFGASYYGMASEGLLSLHHRLQIHCIVNVNTCRKGPDDKTNRLLQVLANTYITRIKNYVKFLPKKEGEKNKNDDIMCGNCDVIAIFPIHGQFEAMRKPDFGCIVRKTYFSKIVTFYLAKNRKQNKKISNTPITLLL